MIPGLWNVNRKSFNSSHKCAPPLQLDASGFSPFGKVLSGLATLRSVLNPTPGDSDGVSQDEYSNGGDEWLSAHYTEITRISRAYINSPAPAPALTPSPSIKPADDGDAWVHFPRKGGVLGNEFIVKRAHTLTTVSMDLKFDFEQQPAIEIFLLESAAYYKFGWALIATYNFTSHRSCKEIDVQETGICRVTGTFNHSLWPGSRYMVGLAVGPTKLGMCPPEYLDRPNFHGNNTADCFGEWTGSHEALNQTLPSLLCQPLPTEKVQVQGHRPGSLFPMDLTMIAQAHDRLRDHLTVRSLPFPRAN